MLVSGLCIGGLQRGKMGFIDAGMGIGGDLLHWGRGNEPTASVGIGIVSYLYPFC